MKISKILENNETWHKKKTREVPNYFQGPEVDQKPKVLWIGCSDSRVPPELIVGRSHNNKKDLSDCSAPGFLFVHRNVANVISNQDVNSASVIRYSMTALNESISDIVVCGHYGCGGVKEALGKTDHGIINPWLRDVRDVHRLYQKKISKIKGDDEKWNMLVELNVLEQCLNLFKNPDVQMRIRQGEDPTECGVAPLKIHGWVYDFGTGELKDLEHDLDAAWKKIAPVYQVDV